MDFFDENRYCCAVWAHAFYFKRMMSIRLRRKKFVWKTQTNVLVNKYRRHSKKNTKLVDLFPMPFFSSDCDSYCCRYQISPKEETSASACSPARFPQGNFQFASYYEVKNILQLCACSSFYAMPIMRTLSIGSGHLLCLSMRKQTEHICRA
jgi:hypothetical protein